MDFNVFWDLEKAFAKLKKKKKKMNLSQCECD